MTWLGLPATSHWGTFRPVLHHKMRLDSAACLEPVCYSLLSPQTHHTSALQAAGMEVACTHDVHPNAADMIHEMHLLYFKTLMKTTGLVLLALS